jgi:hypothetical protein
MPSIAYTSWEEVPEDIMPEVDEGQCEVGIVCANPDRGRVAWIGCSSEGDYRTIVALTSLADREANLKPILACEDCDSWLHDVYALEALA